MEILHNSHEKKFRSPFGAVEVGTKIVLSLEVKDALPSLRCSATVWVNSDDMKVYPMTRTVVEGKEIYSCEIKAPNFSCLMWYHFVLENYDERMYYGNNDMQLGGIGRVFESNPKSYQITVYEKDKVPSWWTEGIAYQIYVDRFNRGSDFAECQENARNAYQNNNRDRKIEENWDQVPYYERDEKGNISRWNFWGGTLKGIEEKLEYLKQLGVTVLYLNPIFEARSNHKYDTGNYKEIDPMYGNDESFSSLVKSAKKLGIHIILDGVFSHTGCDSIYFNKYGNYRSLGAYQSEDSKYFEWYRFQKEKNGIVKKDEYECWWGVKDLPNVNELDKSYLDFICRESDSVIKHWIKMGASGFRLDVADELPDEFIKEIRKAIRDTNKDTILLGEVWEDASNKISYGERKKYFCGDELQSTMNYDLLNVSLDFMTGKINAEQCTNLIIHQKENYPLEYFYANFNLIGSHDRMRILTLLGDAPAEETLSEESKMNFRLSDEKYGLAKSRLKVLSTLQFTLPGIPCIYYGDEVGVDGYKDPYNRKTYPWGREDEDILKHYKKLGEIRTSNKALREGQFKMFSVAEHVIGYFRETKNEEIIVLVNRGIFYNEEVNVCIDVKGSEYKDLYTDERIEVVDGKLNVNVLPLGYKVLKLI